MYYDSNNMVVEGSLVRVRNEGYCTIYEGFYGGNYFKLEELCWDEYNLLEYKEHGKNISVDGISDDLIDDLIEFVQDDEVMHTYNKSIYDDGGKYNEVLYEN